MWLLLLALAAPALAASAGAGAAARADRASSLVARGSSATLQIDNPVKTVADTISDFYKLYPQPPLMPMYRTFIVDMIKQVHLTVVDSRFKYDAIFALGAWEAYNGLMSNYDKLGGSEEADKIWPAFMQACGLDPEKVKADAQAVAEWTKSATPAQILATMEGTATEADARIVDAFSSISTGLYSQPFSVGLFKMMEYSGVEASTTNAEEWAKALKIPPSKPSGDLETYKMNMNKLKAAEERDIEAAQESYKAQREIEAGKMLIKKLDEWERLFRQDPTGHWGTLYKSRLEQWGREVDLSVDPLYE